MVIPQFHNSTIQRFHNSKIPHVRNVSVICAIFFLASALCRQRFPLPSFSVILGTNEVDNFEYSMLRTPNIPHTRRSLTSSHTTKSAVLWSTDYLAGKTSSHIHKTCTLSFLVSVLIKFVRQILR